LFGIIVGIFASILASRLGPFGIGFSFVSVREFVIWTLVHPVAFGLSGLSGLFCYKFIKAVKVTHNMMIAALLSFASMILGIILNLIASMLGIIIAVSSALDIASGKMIEGYRLFRINFDINIGIPRFPFVLVTIVIMIPISLVLARYVPMNIRPKPKLSLKDPSAQPPFRVCPGCGAEVGFDVMFCILCGAKLPALDSEALK
jgi:hypothetical protein